VTAPGPRWQTERDRLRARLRAHRPGDGRETRSLKEILAHLDSLPAPFDRRAAHVHVTASAIVLDEGTRVLLHLHKRIHRWLQPGGHLDVDELPPEGALRETAEESGLSSQHWGPEPLLVHVDVHPAPPGHRHLDLRYLLRADADAPLRPAAGESPEVRWWTQDEALRIADASLAGALRAVKRIVA
jgi:8-oxo-dGTP pyrophosphatase MutT (NUDIX family)